MSLTNNFEDLSNFFGRSFISSDFKLFLKLYKEHISKSNFLVIGGAGTIGSATIKKLFSLNVKRLDVIDSDENSLAELVRDIRSSDGYTTKNFNTFNIDATSDSFIKFLGRGIEYNYILNFAAVKHVRAERNVFSILRMIDVNIGIPLKIVEYLKNKKKLPKLFIVSTDKASDPVNLMGASKQLMEEILNITPNIETSKCRFANVIFSKGSLPESFIYRINLRQPLSVPLDIKRFFISKSESAELCIMTSVICKKNETIIPVLPKNRTLSFKKILENYLFSKKLKPKYFNSEDQARKAMNFNKQKNKFTNWPVFVFNSKTSGEKKIESFFSSNEKVLSTQYKHLKIVKNKKKKKINISNLQLDIQELKNKKNLKINDFDIFFKKYLSNFNHFISQNHLDNQM